MDNIIITLANWMNKRLFSGINFISSKDEGVKRITSSYYMGRDGEISFKFTTNKGKEKSLKSNDLEILEKNNDFMILLDKEDKEILMFGISKCFDDFLVWNKSNESKLMKCTTIDVDGKRTENRYYMGLVHYDDKSVIVLHGEEFEFSKNDIKCVSRDGVCRFILNDNLFVVNETDATNDYTKMVDSHKKETERKKEQDKISSKKDEKSHDDVTIREILERFDEEEVDTEEDEELDINFDTAISTMLKYFKEVPEIKNVTFERSGNVMKVYQTFVDENETYPI